MDKKVSNPIAFPIDIEDLPEYIWLNKKGQLVIDSRVKNWGWLIPTIEDAIKYSGDADEENDEEIDWIEVFENAESILLEREKTNERVT
jgi:hypothetical protein